MILLLLIMSFNTASAETDVDYSAYKEKWDLLNEDKSDWLCVDYAVYYARTNPGWGMVILSPSPTFRFQPHMVNYRIEENILLIHEPQVNRTYELEIVNGTMTVPLYEDYPNDFSSQWEHGTYFYFIPNETGVLRTYYLLQDNRDKFFDYENMSKYNATNISSEFAGNAEVLLSANNTSSSIDYVGYLNNTIIDDTGVERINEQESLHSKVIRFVKSILKI